MELKNCMEEVVQDKLDIVLEQYPDCCRCEQCRSDIAALALNQAAPQICVHAQRGCLCPRQ